MRNAALNASAASDCEAEVVREDALADEPGEAAAEDARARPSDRGAARRRALPALSQRRRLAPASPSVPLDFFIRYDLMNTSRSPSSTRLTSPTCSFVR